jgi:hypothetical protein
MIRTLWPVHLTLCRVNCLTVVGGAAVCIAAHDLYSFILKVERDPGRGGPKIAGNLIDTGRAERIRTSDPLLPKQVRYQAALQPDRGRFLTLVAAFAKPNRCLSGAVLPQAAHALADRLDAGGRWLMAQFTAQYAVLPLSCQSRAGGGVGTSRFQTARGYAALVCRFRSTGFPAARYTGQTR